MRRFVAGCVIAALAVAGLAAAEPQQRQPVPRPFPQPGNQSPGASEPARERPATPTPARASVASAQNVPTEATLGFPIYPNAQFLTSYEAGRSQRYYLFGTNSSFEEMVPRTLR